MSLSDGDNVSQARARRLQESIPVSYTIYKDGSNYRAESCISGLADQSSSTAATVIHNAWDAMTSGGRIHFVGDIDLGTTPIALKLTKYAKGLQLTGEGETRSKLTYTGTGYAITIDTDDAAVGQYYLTLSDFGLTGSSKTASRNGVKIAETGQYAYLQRLLIEQMDIGLLLHDINTVTVDGIRLYTTNTGIETTGGAGRPNALSFNHIRILGATNYGIRVAGSCVQNTFRNIITDSVGTGIFVDARVRGLGISDSYFSCSSVDIDLEGNDWSDPILGAKVDNCYFESAVTSHIIADYVDNLQVCNCYSSGATNFIAPRSDFQTIILDENNYVADTNLSSDLTKLRVSPAWNYVPYTTRMGNEWHVYFADPYLVTRVKNGARASQGHDCFASWLTADTCYGYGTYEWQAKFGPRAGAGTGHIYVGIFEKHHGHASEGIISIEDDTTNYKFVTCTDGGVVETTLIDAFATFTNENTFKIAWSLGECKLYINDTLRATHTDVPTEPAQLFGEATIETADPGADMVCYFKNRSFKQV